MTKLNEQWSLDPMTGRMVIKQQHNFHAVAEKAKALKSAGRETFGESKLAAVIPMKQIHEWAKKHGVRMDDSHAMKEVMRKELMSADNTDFRVWEGTF